MATDRIQGLRDLNLEIARGQINGLSFIHKFGQNPNIDNSGTYVDIWDKGVDYVFPTQARVHNVSSSNLADESTTGTGAQTMEIQGLDFNFDLISETISLDGQIVVPTTKEYVRVFRMKVLTAGISGNNLGDITANAVTDGTDSAQIGSTNNQTLMAIYTIPNGKTGFMSNWYASLSQRITAESTIKIFIRPEGQVFQLKHLSDINSAGSGHIQHFYPVPERIEPRSDIKIQANSSAASNGIAAGFDLILVDNPC